nr:glycosyl hydrolase 108 family protein [Mesorhizobium sp. B2-8-9]
MKGISSDQLFEIYERQCWDAVKGDQLPAGVDHVVFDGAVKSGRIRTGGRLRLPASTVCQPVARAFG